jgi:hypothetical protein
LPEALQELALAAKSARRGETVHSIGNSSCEFTGSRQLWRYTTGKVRGVFSTTLPAFEGKVLETDAPTNKGDSGGPVVNDAGQLVAVAMGYDPGTRLVSQNVDVSEVKTFLQDARERTKRASGFRGLAAALLGAPKKSSPTLAATWKVNSIEVRDGEQRSGECRFLGDGSFELSFSTSKGPMTHKGWYGCVNGVLFIVSPKWKCQCSLHWVKEQRFTLLFSDSMMICDRQRDAEPVSEAVTAK